MNRDRQVYDGNLHSQLQTSHEGLPPAFQVNQASTRVINVKLIQWCSLALRHGQLIQTRERRERNRSHSDLALDFSLVLVSLELFGGDETLYWLRRVCHLLSIVNANLGIVECPRNIDL